MSRGDVISIELAPLKHCSSEQQGGGLLLGSYKGTYSRSKDRQQLAPDAEFNIGRQGELATDNPKTPSITRRGA